MSTTHSFFLTTYNIQHTSSEISDNYSIAQFYYKSDKIRQIGLKILNE